MKNNFRMKEAVSVINALNSGVVPKLGIQHIVVGRDREVKALLDHIEEVNSGNSVFKFWIGEYGNGKSFMLSLLKIIALKQDYVVANADFSPLRRLYGSDRKSVSTYSELIKNISIKTKPDGNALPIILEKWIEKLFIKISKEKNIPIYDLHGSSHIRTIQDYVFKSVLSFSEIGGMNFGQVIARYIDGYLLDDEYMQENAMKWLRGEYTTKTEARQDLRVREIINDKNYYDMLKNLSNFFVSIGYKGFMINFDEAVNLYKIPNSISRKKNYDKILDIFNDCVQGHVSHLFVNIAGIPEFLTDKRRGLYSDRALKSRLELNRFENDDIRDFEQPVIDLKPLKSEDIFVLLKKILDIYNFRYSIDINLDDLEIKDFIQNVSDKRVARDRITPRHFLRDFLNLLKIIRQNPDYDKSKFFNSIKRSNKTSKDNMENLSNIKEI